MDICSRCRKTSHYQEYIYYKGKKYCKECYYKTLIEEELKDVKDEKLKKIINLILEMF